MHEKRAKKKKQKNIRDEKLFCAFSTESEQIEVNIQPEALQPVVCY
jgi:hypothetical protein